MQTYKGRPIIEARDSPQVVDEALRESVRYWNENMPFDQAFAWEKKAADAWGALEDGFGIIDGEVHKPKGQALLRISPDELELALVAYGCELIDTRTPNTDVEVLAIDSILKQIDVIKS